MVLSWLWKWFTNPESESSLPRFAKAYEYTEDERKTLQLWKTIRGILNKVTPETLETSVRKMKILETSMDTLPRLQLVIDLIHHRAVNEPEYCRWYAKMFHSIQNISVPNEEMPSRPITIRTQLINKCQWRFERHEEKELNARNRQEEIEECTDPKQRRKLMSEFEEMKRCARRESVGNCRLIGELFKLSMLTEKIVLYCVNQLATKIDEGSLEGLCVLLSTVGQSLESKVDKPTFDVIFNKMRDISENESYNVSSRIRFMLQDVIDLRRNHWIPRRGANNPETISELNQEYKGVKQKASMFTKNGYWPWGEVASGTPSFGSWRRVSSTKGPEQGPPNYSCFSSSAPPMKKDAGQQTELEMNLNATDKNDRKTKELLETIRCISNGKTTKKFDMVVSVITSKGTDIFTFLQLRKVIDLIFQSAIDDVPQFCWRYANMCYTLRQMLRRKETPENPITITTLLTDKCLTEFELDKTEKFNAAKRLNEIEADADSEENKKSTSKFKEIERRLRRRSVGNCRFMGELFNFDLLTVETIMLCVNQLASQVDEESLECLCVLLWTTGQNLESKVKKKTIDSIWKKVGNFLATKPSNVSSKILITLLRCDRFASN